MCCVNLHRVTYILRNWIERAIATVLKSALQFAKKKVAYSNRVAMVPVYMFNLLISSNFEIR